ncbi:retinol dehydrogenase 14 (all-trans/9-cis/11-cis) [Monoraphidium neglectum]|uniref:Retinol dehydrogenase 14 (All-trans/9-cis/11-cis) n=1 Tax=Monoraphidium neglectum TaxID=145388 RepID=A0A0D2MCJ7_9CHLO|nr:retinol dehydrogenase 14 (all-trans/9-cis/11-cis) [Monoraphidium neglectum]KIY98551.1 retinol dehydrogenase 14 (all-trans/9-cis/11-cis) [Monoraphidium neglectum]|eukprot:XP_013897571.1 retinol dehydrogenase 14 (all-trans/9-cis/11-cis) [Monoraphidium neglectum]
MPHHAAPSCRPPWYVAPRFAPEARAKPVRIVNVASAAHAFGKIDFDSFRSSKGYSEWPTYGQSKLANILFTYELARRLKGAGVPTVNALHPGVVRTELGRYLLSDDASFLTKAMWSLMTPFTKTPVQGAQTSIFLASSPEAEGITGKYYSDCKPISSTPASYDVDVAKKLYDVSLELVGAPVSSTVA